MTKNLFDFIKKGLSSYRFMNLESIWRNWDYNKSLEFILNGVREPKAVVFINAVKNPWTTNKAPALHFVGP